MAKKQSAVYALLLTVIMMSMAVLACNSDQEWIIPRTATPTATPTPLPITGDAAFTTGDSVVVIADTFQVALRMEPGPEGSGNVVLGGQCFPGQTISILDVAQGEDGLIYYKVNCILDGWIAPENLELAE